jgi:hypothetical protein
MGICDFYALCGGNGCADGNEYNSTLEQEKISGASLGWGYFEEQVIFCFYHLNIENYTPFNFQFTILNLQCSSKSACIISHPAHT